MFPDFKWLDLISPLYFKSRVNLACLQHFCLNLHEHFLFKPIRIIFISQYRENLNKGQVVEMAQVSRLFIIQVVVSSLWLTMSLKEGMHYSFCGDIPAKCEAVEIDLMDCLLVK